MEEPKRVEETRRGVAKMAVDETGQEKTVAGDGAREREGRFEWQEEENGVEESEECARRWREIVILLVCNNKNDRLIVASKRGAMRGMRRIIYLVVYLFIRLFFRLS